MSDYRKFEEIIKDAASHGFDIVGFAENQTSSPVVGLLSCLVAAGIIYQTQPGMNEVSLKYLTDFFKRAARGKPLIV